MSDAVTEAAAADDGQPAPRRFTRRLKEEKIQIEREDGVAEEFFVREMKGTAKGQWQTKQATRLNKDAAGNPVSIRDFVGIEADLISRCLFDSANRPVPEATILNWPTTLQKELFEVCQDINGLNDKAREREKNS